MSSDRSWMKRRFNGIGGITDDYKRGMDDFVKFAQQTKGTHGLIRCPCTKCKNLAWITEDEVKFHLYQNGIIEAYTVWHHHGEKVDRRNPNHAGTSHNHNSNEDDDMYDAFELLSDIGEQYQFKNMEEEPNKEAADFYKVVNDASVPLYPNCEEHSKLSFVTKLLHFKNMYGCSQKAFDELLKLIGSVLTSPHTLPETYQNVKNMVKGLHLVIHLAIECMLGGPVQYGWMYVFERYLHKLKLTVKNKARVEGSMAERYIEEELTNFCSLYFESDVATVHNRLQRNEVPRQNHYPHLLEAYTYPTSKVGREKHRYLIDKELEIVKYYVLINMPEVAEYLDEFEELTYKKKPDLDPTIFEAYAKKKFISWFERRVKPDKELHDKFKDMIAGPYQRVQSYSGCKCNGYKFVSPEPGQLTLPNSGVYVQGTCYNEIEGNYYGRLEEVVKLTYRNGHNIMLFKCHWFDSTRNVKVDKHRMTTVNVKSQLDAQDIFVLASQAVQVYYAPNINNQNSPWYTVVTTKNPPQNEITSCAGDALQQEESNASMSHVETIVIDNPANFFVDLTNISTNDEHVPDNEENVPESQNDDSIDDNSGESEEDSS